MNYINIIGTGMGHEDMTMFHMKLVKDSDLLIGGKRQLALFPDYSGERVKITGNIPELVLKIKAALPLRRIVVLASGDPLFYGMGSTLARHLPESQLRIHPNVSSLSAAFAKIRLPWQDAKVISLHSAGSQDPELLGLSNHNKFFFLTSPKRGPAFIAKQFKQLGVAGFKFCVLENIGDSKREKITWFSDVETISHTAFSDPNVVIVTKDQEPVVHKGVFDNVSHETFLGMPEEAFRHTGGLITKPEVRVLSLSKLKLNRPDHILWDIGSGSGSVGVEAAPMIPEGKVIAIEKDPSRIKDIEYNINKFKLTNICVHEMIFPDEKTQLPLPDRIFIGGGGKGLQQVICSAAKALRPAGVLVVNTVVIDNMACALKALNNLGMSPEVTHVQISRSAAIGDGQRLSPLNPVWIISGIKPLER